MFGTAHDEERAPLLPKANSPGVRSRPQRLKAWLHRSSLEAYEFSKTSTARNIFKCSIAYLLATLTTFSVPVASFLGAHQDGNQLIANIVVWFDPARSAGSMDLGIIFAFLAFLYGSFIAFSSQAVSAFFASQDLLVVGHVFVLLIFCWGGLGLVAWFKQYMGHPLVNTATSLASLAIVTCLTKEGAVQTGDFSYRKITQVLKMLVVGILISFVINLAIWPKSARKALRDNLVKTTDAFGDLLTTITSSFLSGSDEDMNHPTVVAAAEKFKSVFGSLPNQLAEARYEHHPLGTESQYHIEARLVQCVQRLAQDIGGLRSAAATQFALLSESGSHHTPQAQTYSNGATTGTSNRPPEASNSSNPRTNFHFRRSSTSSNFSGNDETSPQDSTAPNITKGTSEVFIGSAQTPEHIFETFIEHLGPPMVRAFFSELMQLHLLTGSRNPLPTR